MSYTSEMRRLVGHSLLHIPGARGVIQNSSGEFLLEKRKDFGVWGVPSGSAESYENIADTMVREIYEETGLSATSVKPFGYASNPDYEVIRFPNGDMIHSFSVLFHIESFTGQLQLCADESTDLSWFSYESLPEMLPNMRRTLDAFIGFRETGEFQLI